MKITLTGDSLFSSRNLNKRIEKNICSFLQESDAVFTNAEFCTPKNQTAPAAGRGYVTAVRENRLDELKKLGFNLVNFANNHTGDFGVQGIMDTIHAAEARDLDPIGLGRSLDEANQPRFLDTESGRVAVVAASATRSEIFRASNGGNGVPARPGLNPLRWEQTYVVPAADFDNLKKINNRLGLSESIDVGTEIERWEPLPSDEIYVGSMYQDKIHFKKGKDYQVRTTLNLADAAALIKQVRDAKNRANFTIFSLHTHEGLNENWYADKPADFVREIARQAIDAGADVVIGHGAHFLRGIELYHGKPIFYNLGSFLMEFEAGESIIPPKMYEAYQLPDSSLPSVLHRKRAYNNGKLAGFNSKRIFSAGLALQIDFVDGKAEYRLLPLDLQMDAPDSLKRGIPKIASKDFTAKTIQRMQMLSNSFETKVSFEYKNGKLKLEKINFC